MKIGDMVAYYENQKYVGVVLSLSIIPNYFHDSGGKEPVWKCEVLWSGDVPPHLVGNGMIRSIPMDMLEVLSEEG